jgi:uncharacterized phiE125 gp8 family phage protein
MNIIVVQQPPFEPLNLAEIYVHLRLDLADGEANHPDDAALRGMIKAARLQCEKVTRRSFIQQTLRLVTGSFNAIELHRPPVQYVETVQYFDADNVLQTVAAADWYVTDDLVPQLRLVSNWSSPTLYNRPDAVRVDYVAGYEPIGSPPTTQWDYAENVPEDLKSAMKLIVGDMYEVREGSIIGSRDVNPAVEALLSAYRVFTV